VSTGGDPHVVPVVFALSGQRIFTAVDGKPKSTTRLRRLANIAATGRASLLVDAYDDDWTRLWWVRADGSADIAAASTPLGAAAIGALVAKYPQYEASPPPGPVIVIAITRLSGWRAADFADD
jgi:PPOX class probable F420-dependent enzyme